MFTAGPSMTGPISTRRGEKGAGVSLLHEPEANAGTYTVAAAQPLLITRSAKKHFRGK